MTGLNTDVARLYETALPAARTGALYNAMSYPTKISAESVALFLATHTEPGDTVLDVFGGSGSTGIAAMLCDKPTAKMIELAAEMGLTPSWGPRTAFVYDISVVGTHAARVLCNPPDPDAFEKAAKELIGKASDLTPGLYEATDPKGKSGEIRHIIWSELLVCPSCGARTPYADARVRNSPLRFVDVFTCVCGEDVKVDACERASETYPDPLTGQTSSRKARVPWRVYGRTEKTQWSRAAASADSATAAKAALLPVPASAPIAAMTWGDLYRAGYHAGMTHLHHLYTPRNFLAVATLWSLTDEYDDDMRDALRLLILSFNAAHSTLMTRVVLKHDSKDFVLTGAQSGVLYVSGLPVEKNVYAGVLRKIKTFRDAFNSVRGSTSAVTVVTGSSTDLALEDRSVDYVFTDPPFGDFIPYAEINQVNEHWLGQKTDQVDEAVISDAQDKGLVQYEKLLRSVFAEVNRVLTDEGRATVVFHASRADVWKALTQALEKSGFRVERASVLDKTQPSFKQVVSKVTAKGDPLLLLAKGTSEAAEPLDLDAVTADVLAIARASGNPAELERERLYSRFVNRCLEAGAEVSLGNAEFYKAAGLEGSTSLAEQPTKTTAATEGFASDAERRKRLGQVFTGTKLATLLATLARAGEGQSIIDPMVGTGDMLLGCIAAGAAPARFVGVELDTHALDEAASRLAEVDVELSCCDAFTFDYGSHPFDLVITNPPYVRYQSTSEAAGETTRIPSAAEIRRNLLKRLDVAPGLDEEDRVAFRKLAKGYSGLSDTAVPAWLLAASLVAVGGRIAVVVPNSWLTRDYALPIKYMLMRWFDVECVVEDGDASWFSDALVRTTLVVARRVERKPVPFEPDSTMGYVHCRVSEADADDESIVGRLGGDSQFLSHIEAAELGLAGARRVDPQASVDEFLHAAHDVRWLSELSGVQVGSAKVVSLPESLRDLIPSSVVVDFGDLSTVGWQVGQGLRSGANDFFYGTVQAGGKTRTSETLGGELLGVPPGVPRLAVRNQADLPSSFVLDETDLRTRLLDFNGYASRTDLARWKSALPKTAKLPFKPLSPTVSSYLDKAADVELVVKGATKRLPELSAVAPNVREPGSGRDGNAPSAWYHLPTLAARHTPDLLVPRVCSSGPRFVMNPGRTVVVDANFSTLWQVDSEGWPVTALLAFLNSRFVRLVLECSASVMGGGALKVEASHLRRVPVPALTGPQLEKLAALGRELATGADTDVVLERVDLLVAESLVGRSAATTFASAVAEQLAKRTANRG